MASEKQIAANRANARLSCGPKTLAGKQKSSRNAYRHGLSGPAPSDPETLAKVEIIARIMVGGEAIGPRLALATDFAHAQAELLRIRAIRNERLAFMSSNGTNPRDLRQLAALGRYERYALTKRRRASVDL